MSADLGKDATGAKPADGPTGRTCDLRPSVSTDASSAAQGHRWTERDDSGRVWLCWYEPASDPRESRSWLNRTLIGVPA